MAISGVSSEMSGMHASHHGQQAAQNTANRPTAQKTSATTDLAKTSDPHKGHIVDLSA